MSQEENKQDWSLLKGEFIAQGNSRKVYVYKPNELYVIKFAYNLLGKKHNKIENLVYISTKETDFNDLFVPVIDVDKDYGYIIMKRGEEIEYLPKNIPEWIYDKQIKNWVKIDNKIMMCDYGDINIANKFKLIIK